MYKDIFIKYDMEKYLKEPSVCHEEISIKYTNDGISTNRMNYGFEPTKMNDLPAFLTEKLGVVRYNKFLTYFKREIEDPRTDEYMMIGYDGHDYELYVEYESEVVGEIRSYDIGKDAEFMYSVIDPDIYSNVYTYLENALPYPMFNEFCRFLPVRKCETIYSKLSPLHKCIYLFRPRVFPQVKFIKELLMSAAKVVNVKSIDLDDSMYLSFVAIGITRDDTPELAYYFRRERSQRVVKPAVSQ
jgi:hypothetical protein